MEASLSLPRPKGYNWEIVRLFKGIATWLFAKNPHPNMIANYHRFGSEFGAHSVEEFVAMAKKFYKEALNNHNKMYTLVLLPKHRAGIDFDSTYRGIYEADGTPVAFFRPNFRELGYNSKDEEMAAWKKGSIQP